MSRKLCVSFVLTHRVRFLWVLTWPSYPHSTWHCIHMSVDCSAPVSELAHYLWDALCMYHRDLKLSVFKVTYSSPFPANLLLLEAHYLRWLGPPCSPVNRYHSSLLCSPSSKHMRNVTHHSPVTIPDKATLLSKLQMTILWNWASAFPDLPPFPHPLSMWNTLSFLQHSEDWIEPLV